MSRGRVGVALGGLLGLLASVALVVFLVARPSGLVRANHRDLLEGTVPSGTALPYGLEVPRDTRLLGGVFPHRMDAPGQEARYGFEAALVVDPDNVASVLESFHRRFPASADGSPRPSLTEGHLAVSEGRLALLRLSVEGEPVPPETVPVSSRVTGGAWKSTGTISVLGRKLEIQVEEGSALFAVYETRFLDTVLNALLVVDGDPADVMRRYERQLTERLGETNNTRSAMDVGDTRVSSERGYCPGGCGFSTLDLIEPPSGPTLLRASVTPRS